jgi:hypothetical protein
LLIWAQQEVLDAAANASLAARSRGGIANMDSQFGYGQLTLAFPFLTMLFAISQDGYTYPGHQILSRRLIHEPHVPTTFSDVVQLRTVLVVPPIRHVHQLISLGNIPEGVIMRTFGFAFVLLAFSLSFGKAQTPPNDPGVYLLHAVKAVADSGQANDPAAVAALINLSFTNSGYSEAVPDSCKPAGQWKRNIYNVTGNNWFHPLPTGKQYLIRPSLLYVPGPTKLTLDYPKIGYSTLNYEGCSVPSGLNSAQSSGYLDFDNIPTYACINAAQVKAVFPSPKPAITSPGQLSRTPPPSQTFGPPPSFTFERVYDVPDVEVVFNFMRVADESSPYKMSECLLGVELLANYPMGPLHKPHFSN